MIWMLPLIGAAAGALMNKKDPLKGAMMGGALGLTGGALAPAAIGAMGAGGGLLGGAAGTGAAGSGLLGSAAADPIAAYLATGATEGSTLGSALTGAGGSAGAVGQGSAAGLLNMGKQAASAIKPYGEAMSAANQVKGLFAGEPDAPIQAAPTPEYAGGSQILAQLAQQGTQDQQQTMQAELERRKRRMGLLGDA